MRRCAILLLFAGFSFPAMASKSLPVEEFEELLAKLQNKPDARVAQELADVELTERVSLERLTQWEKSFPGAKSHEALMRLADSAAFLKTPALDLLRIAPPDNDTQEKMLALASDYVKTSMTRLPNLSASRETTHFEDAAAAGSAAEWHIGSLGISPGKTESKPLHGTGSSVSTVTYRNGKEVPAEERAIHSENRPPTGLTTSGEFGPVLAVVIGDVVRNQVTWSHWEQSSGDPMAVLTYAVPEDHSNFEVQIPVGARIENVYPAYHGEIAIDPATGGILRLTVVADLMGPYQSMQAAIVVEYAPVAIEDRTCICPVHGVALSRIPTPGAAQGEHGGAMQTQMNDVEFTHYHLFGSEARIIAGDEGHAGQPTPPANANATPEGSPPDSHQVVSPAATVPPAVPATAPPKP